MLKKLVYLSIKRLFDVLFSGILLILLFPILCIVSIVLTISNNGSPFFVQRRPGLNEKIFLLYKFRSMNDNRDVIGNLLSDEDRLTAIGIFLRKYSIDELLQLLNVFKGEMSFVGPRPLLVRYIERYNTSQRRRHDVKPGITGWAQVNGRNAISWSEKFELDLYYVENAGFLIDIKIIFLTVFKVIRRRDISSETSATMEEFYGN